MSSFGANCGNSAVLFAGNSFKKKNITNLPEIKVGAATHSFRVSVDQIYLLN